MASCLILADREGDRHLLTEALVSQGVSPIVETSVAPCERHLSLVDVVFLDWDLPRYGALDVLRMLHETDSEVRPHLILCMAQDDPRLGALLDGAGVGQRLLKPLATEAIADAYSFFFRPRFAPNDDLLCVYR